MEMATADFLDPSPSLNRFDDSSHSHYVGCCPRVNVLRLESLQRFSNLPEGSDHLSVKLPVDLLIIPVIS